MATTTKPAVKRHKWEASDLPPPAAPPASPIKSMSELAAPRADVPGDKVYRCTACALLRCTYARKFVKQFRNGNLDINYVDIEKFSRDGETWLEGKTACSVVMPKAAPEAQENG